MLVRVCAPLRRREVCGALSRTGVWCSLAPRAPLSSTSEGAGETKEDAPKEAEAKTRESDEVLEKVDKNVFTDAANAVTLQLTAERDDFKDKWIRALAEMENVRAAVVV